MNIEDIRIKEELIKLKKIRKQNIYILKNLKKLKNHLNNLLTEVEMYNDFSNFEKL
jgi:hypothetical protein